MKSVASERILFVDDELNLLEGMRRQLRNQFNLETSSSGAEALQVMTAAGPYAVAVADMRMPGMNGIQFLRKAKEVAPQTVRIMLTGNADQQTAVDAVNEGSIFRFLSKPCSLEVLTQALHAGIDQYRLIIAEKELLERTLSGSVKVLTEMLSLVNPVAYGRASRAQRIVHHIVAELKTPEAWKYELAAMLSQVGCVMLPAELLDKVYAGQSLTEEEERLFASHPSVCGKLLSKIPRLESVAAMIDRQQQPYDQQTPGAPHLGKDYEITLGAQLLKLALDLDQKIQGGAPLDLALQDMRKETNKYNPALVAALGGLHIRRTEAEVRAVHINDLRLQMILDEDIYTTSGVLLLRRGHEVNTSVLVMLRRYAGGIGVVEPFRVRVPVYVYGTQNQDG